MIYHNIEQNTPEWEQLRLGRFTASSFKDLFMKETTQTYQDAIFRVAFERLTQESPENYTNFYMERGHELEGEAREWYELETYNKVNNGGFFELNEWVGASPDGLVGSDGLVEIKCPKYSTLINYLIKRELPSIYLHQVQGQMLVTGRLWCDFVAYHPKLKPLVVTVKRDEAIIKDIQDHLNIAIGKAQEIIKQIEKA